MLIKLIVLPARDFAPMALTRAKPEPVTIVVPEYNCESSAFLTGFDSPVIELSSIVD